jgi:hypothetical protein
VSRDGHRDHADENDGGCAQQGCPLNLLPEALLHRSRSVEFREQFVAS